MRFHRAIPRDSCPVVTPFVRVGIYPTRNFALRFLLYEGPYLHPLRVEHGVWSLRGHYNLCHRTSLLIIFSSSQRSLTSQHIAMFVWTNYTLLHSKAASWCFICLPHNRSSPSRNISRCVVNLRTIIVIADIDQGLYRPAKAHSARDTFVRTMCSYHQYLTFWHWSGVTPYTSSYEFAGSCVFGKQSPGILSLRPLT